mmetsp:Transcript_10032/g.21714  ORF Transcript_10032/g.21714 Transcript_10032/m.21714 type:complete len:241 (-) Transcript_10032:1283-2005(-)
MQPVDPGGTGTSHPLQRLHGQSSRIGNVGEGDDATSWRKVHGVRFPSGIIVAVGGRSGHGEDGVAVHSHLQNVDGSADVGVSGEAEGAAEFPRDDRQAHDGASAVGAYDAVRIRVGIANDVAGVGLEDEVSVVRVPTDVRDLPSAQGQRGQRAVFLVKQLFVRDDQFSGGGFDGQVVELDRRRRRPPSFRVFVVVVTVVTVVTVRPSKLVPSVAVVIETVPGRDVGRHAFPPVPRLGPVP